MAVAGGLFAAGRFRTGSPSLLMLTAANGREGGIHADRGGFQFRPQLLNKFLRSAGQPELAAVALEQASAFLPGQKLVAVVGLLFRPDDGYVAGPEFQGQVREHADFELAAPHFAAAIPRPEHHLVPPAVANEGELNLALRNPLRALSRRTAWLKAH